MSAYSKFIVAAVMAGVQFFQSYSGIDLGIDDATVSTVISAITAGMVYLVPNK